MPFFVHSPVNFVSSQLRLATSASPRDVQSLLIVTATMTRMNGKKAKALPAKSRSKSSSNPDRVVSLKAKRSGGKTRDKATIKRLQLYREGGVKRNKAGKVIGGALASRDTTGGQQISGSTGRIAPDRRWFGNTRTVGSKELDKFREEMRTVAADPRSVVLHRRKLPMALLSEDVAMDSGGAHRAERVVAAKSRRAELLSAAPFESATYRKRLRKMPPNMSGSGCIDLAALAKSARAAESEYDARVASLGGADERSAESELAAKMDGIKTEARHDLFAKGQSKRIWAELYKVLDCSDVVLHVLDARDVPGTTCGRVVRHLKERASHKHLVFVVNKCDLAPNWAVRKWIKHLAETAPALAFRAGLGKSFGKGALIDVLRQFAKLKTDAKQVSVGVVGFPNVGKSSVINALKSKAVCKVAPVPGETKVWQYVALTKCLNLIDSPGVVVDAEDDVQTVLKGVIRAERLPDPTAFVAPLLKQSNPHHLLKTYELPFDPLAGKDEVDDDAFEDAALDYVRQLAFKMGRLLSGGEPDLRTVATMLINDWQRGKRLFPVSFMTPHHQANSRISFHRPTMLKVTTKLSCPNYRERATLPKNKRMSITPVFPLNESSSYLRGVLQSARYGKH